MVAMGAITAGIGGGLVVHASLVSGAATFTLRSVTSDALAQENLRLLVPAATDATSTTITANSAQQAAAAGFPGPPKVIESALADVSDPNVPLINGKLLWVVSLDPTSAPRSSGPPGSKEPGPPTRFLVFIDPSTGKFVFGDIG
jgi:hypothetical protein